MQRFLISLLVLAGSGLVACQPGASGTGGSSGGSGSSGSTGGGAAVTAVGAPIAGLDVAHANIDASGGTLASPDGQLTLTVPAGALSSSTQVSITAIQNTSPGGVGFGYRFGPDGQTFAQPVTLTFKPTYGQLDGATPTLDNLVLAYQTAEGKWLQVPGLTADAAGHTATATTTHFTDYAFLLSLQLLADHAAVLGGQTASLDVESVPLLGAPGSDIYLGLAVKQQLTGTPTWKLNGVPQGAPGADGEIIGLGNSASYQAPAQQPPNNPEAVSVTYTASGGAQITLVNSIYVLAHKYDLQVTISDTVDGCSNSTPYLWASTESADIDLDLDDALNLSASNPSPAGAPNVGGVSCCVSSCSAAFNPADEPIAMALTNAQGGWDAQNHRLRVVARGQNKLIPALEITIGGTTTTVNGDGPDTWNAPGFPFYLNGALSIDDETIPRITPGYQGSIGGSIRPKQF